MNEQKILKENIKLCHSMANKFKAKLHSVEYDDILQNVCIGFINALRKHDPKRGKLSTAAHQYARKEVYRHYYNTGSTIRIPEHAQTGKTKKDIKFNFLSLDSPIQGYDEVMWYDVLEDRTAPDPQDIN